MAYSGMPNVTDPPCLGCGNWEHCKRNRQACAQFARYASLGGTGWPRRVQAQGSPVPTRQEYDEIFSGEEEKEP